MNDRRSQFPFLVKFMQCYWMENADIVYGNLHGATNAYLSLESKLHWAGLLKDLESPSLAQFLVTGNRPTSSEEKFWLRFGARWLSINDVEHIKMKIKSKR